jgi:hypothetical protein
LVATAFGVESLIISSITDHESHSLVRIASPR